MRRDQHVGIDLFQFQCDIAEILIGGRMREHLNHFNARWGQPLGHNARDARAKPGGFLVHNRNGFGRVARRFIDCQKAFHSGFGDRSESRAKAEGIGQATADNLVADPDINRMRNPVLGGSLCGCETNVGRVGPNNRRHVGIGHFFNFACPDLGFRLRIAQHSLN